ncbi:MAG TPA: hypothetical protein VJ715_05805 [Pyrinomonadaceae bacterium]|nr:hypothetical protein [Pyrinomonadaceae bacterium]
MLFIETKTSGRGVESSARLALLEKLQEKGLTPLIRSARLSCYEQALLGPDRVAEMEREVAAWTEAEDDRAYICGDVFCFEDFALFLIFGDNQDNAAGMRAGIVYGAEMLEPMKKLDAFCRNVSDALEALRAAGSNGGGPKEIEWQRREPPCLLSESGRFGGAENGTAAEGGTGGAAGARAVELLEDMEVRRLMRRVAESQAEGRVSEILSNVEDEAATASLISRMADAGLLRREVLVSCRKKERAIFRLPSPDALNVITATNAVCSECGTAIADEKIEDLVKPTDAAARMLEDGSWLASRVHSSLRELGVPESQIITARAAEGGEAHIMVSVCDEPFLLVMRDGDVTAAQARHALAAQAETEAAHLVVIASGRIQDEARVRLRERARRRSRGGDEVEVLLIEGVDAGEELGRAFERVSRNALANELSALDTSLGLSTGFVVATRFRLMQRTGALKDLAESAVGALAGSLREF